jgi:hypothetical protein
MRLGIEIEGMERDGMRATKVFCRCVVSHLFESFPMLAVLICVFMPLRAESTTAKIQERKVLSELAPSEPTLVILTSTAVRHISIFFFALIDCDRLARHR